MNKLDLTIIFMVLVALITISFRTGYLYKEAELLKLSCKMEYRR